ncbi:MAG: hypothetical protein ACRC33_00820 [Gemmataceae bacterium]
MSVLLLLVAGATLELTVAETAGIRRFGYPVKVKLAMKDDLTGKERFRLLDGKKPVPAQFRPAGRRDVWLDFTLSPGPMEKKALAVEYGPDVPAGPEPKDGLTLAEEGGAFVVRSGGMRYAVPADLGGLLAGVKGGTADYLKSGGKGLWVGDGRAALKGLKGVVARRGPLAVALAFTGPGVEVQMTFPRSKSWVEVEVAAGADAVGADLKLDLATPGLVDFGAGTGVYVALKAGETASFRPHEAGWVTAVGDKPYVVGTSPFEGWAHAMDRTRCTAVSVEGFGPGDEVVIGADGGLRLAKRGKRLRFWLHFVPMPPHVGAVTSPQAMLAPLAVEVKTP